MSLTAAVIRELVAAGVTGDALVTACERIEAAATPVRSKGAERTARWRERHKASQNVTGGGEKGFDKERFHTSKEITSKTTNDDTQPAREDFEEVDRDLVTTICEVVACIPGPLPDDATACHDAVEAALLAEGLQVLREAPVRNGDGVVGRYDLVVHRDEARAAIEIDRRLGRAKSAQKLLGFRGGRIQILRGSDPPHKIIGIDAVLSLPIGSKNRPRNPRIPFPDDFWPNETSLSAAHGAGLRSTADVNLAVSNIRDWSKNADGAKGLKADWQAFFRLWVRNNDKHKSSIRYTPKPSAAEQLQTAFDDLRQRNADRRGAAGHGHTDRPGPDRHGGAGGSVIEHDDWPG